MSYFHIEKNNIQLFYIWKEESKKAPICGNSNLPSNLFPEAKKAILQNLGQSLKEMISSQEKVDYME